jgi:protein tyrosine phosphatase (PTP) superfamily phosphohydrolase (DUF442 family)
VQKPDPAHIANWLRLDARITTSGQPSEEQLAELQDLGVRHVINLALHSHEKALADERRSVESLGMRYIHIPVDFGDPTASNFEDFCAALNDCGNDPVHVHCIVNARVSAFFYRYRRDVLGWRDAEARMDMAKIWDPADWAESGRPWLAFLSLSQV